MDHEEGEVVAEHRCENCQSELVGDYCHACGQKALHHDSWSLKHFLHEFWHETVHLDSKVFVTLKLLLLKPGSLTREFLDGHRQPFINPIRLYLVITAIFFFFGAQTDFNIEGFQRSGNAAGLTNFVQLVAEHKKIPYEVELQIFNQGFHKKFSILIALGVLLFGYAVHLAYRKQEHWFGRSLVFAVHFFSLFFLLLLVWRIALHQLSNNGIKTPMQGFFVVALLFLAISLRRVWPESPRRYVPKVLFLWVTSFTVYSLSIGLAIALQIFSYGRLAKQLIDK